MGTSIHCHLEVSDGDKWYHWSAPAIYRDEIFFDLLAGIYGRIPPIVPLRDLPEGMSEVTSFCYNQDVENYSPLHHRGWLKSEELDLLQIELNKHFKALHPEISPRKYDLEDGYFHTFINGNAIMLHQGWKDVRLIFWFDN